MFFVAIVLVFVAPTSGKVFSACEFANEMIRLKVPKEQVPTWVCIARHESNFNTSAVGRLNWDGSEDHGIFQISDKFWCSPPGGACGIDCSSLRDDDIADDWKCARRIFRQHKILQGNGFKAWAVYGPHCSGDTSPYTSGCGIDFQGPNSLTSLRFNYGIWPLMWNPWTAHYTLHIAHF